jgi:MscS family membrane protein
MIRTLLILLWAVLAAGTVQAAEQQWTGEWQLTWGNGGALVKLQQDGNTVGGSFGIGLIRGTARGSQFDGQIVYNGETEPLTATLSNDGNSFAGTTEAGDWLNGVRITPENRQSAAINVDLSSPRAALRSFLVAASMARANRSYALASALDTIDFGDDPDWASREARFSGAQHLFQLIDRATFNLSTIPDDNDQRQITLALPQLDAKTPITLDMQRNAEGLWHIVMPSPARLRAAREAAGVETADGFRLMQNPRDTIRAFLDGMQHWDSGGEAQALGAIDLSHVPDVLRQTEGSFVAQYLVRILDQVGHRTLSYVPNSGTSREPFVFFELPAGRIVIEPVGTGKDTQWKFSAETAHDIRDIYRAAEQLPSNDALDASFIPYSPTFALRDQVKRFAPFLLGTLPGPGHLEYWQVAAGLAALAAIILSTLLLRRALQWLLTRPRLKRHVANPGRLALALALGISFLVGSRFVLMVGLPAVTRQYTVPVLGTILIGIIGYALWQLVVFLLSVLESYAEKTETAIDNILLTFVAGVAKLSIVVGAVLGLSYLWSLPTSGLLAGLGISGLAVAFASKETLSNIFGAGILLGDRPFRKGDRIIAGDVNGWVEAVGLRSTRIRTLYDSLLVVPNGKLADMVVNNLGARRRRSLSTTVIVTSGATPQRMEAFIRDIRQRIAEDPIFEGKWSEVNITRMWHEGIDVEISTMVETRSGRSAREATHKLYLDIMQLAEQHGLTLAHATDPLARQATAEA